MASNAKVTKLPTVEDELKARDALPDNLRIWKALGKTDPKHTKGFSRAGGFKGTAIKPIWITQRLTELFGPCGTGWGMERPQFQVVEASGETLVYCTVEAWYRDDTAPRPKQNDIFPEDTGKRSVYGVGGDKVVTKRQSGPFCDDEAFKKAFTDALGNAFKFIGVGADVHMGLFEDSKYLAAVNAEFHPPVNDEHKTEDAGRKEGDMSASALKGSLRMLVHHINGCGTVTELEDLLETDDAKEVMENCERRFPAWWATGEGMPAEFVPLKKLIAQTRKGLKELENQDG